MNESLKDALWTVWLTAGFILAVAGIVQFGSCNNGDDWCFWGVVGRAAVGVAMVRIYIDRRR